ncbi:hypothetical protein Q0F99_18860 [Rathayibacter oskolensis]|nr:hypothetical protein [Rathayibacter oskolensis]WKK71413.1 hypothetical protein Q0F99_18860 [Rathayibacter oskolensis]
MIVWEAPSVVPKGFRAATVKTDSPAVVGVPERTPAELRVSPSGRVPDDTSNVAALSRAANE